MCFCYPKCDCQNCCADNHNVWPPHECLAYAIWSLITLHYKESERLQESNLSEILLWLWTKSLMRTSLESGLFCFTELTKITIRHLTSFLCLVWLNFTGHSKIDINVLQMESQDIIKVVLTWRTTFKMSFSQFAGFSWADHTIH